MTRLTMYAAVYINADDSDFTGKNCSATPLADGRRILVRFTHITHIFRVKSFVFDERLVHMTDHIVSYWNLETDGHPLAY